MLFAILGSVIAGSAVITAASLTTKEKPAQPMTINNNINNINNSFNNKMTNTVKNAEIDHDAIVDELYTRYKIDKNTDDLNNLLNRIDKLK